MMKTIIIFYNDTNNTLKNQKVFNNLSAKDMCLELPKKVSLPYFEVTNVNSNLELLETIINLCEKENATDFIFLYDDLPFVNEKLTKQLLKAHEEYKAEYTFADGYPNGFCPEVMNAGSAKILLNLIKSSNNSIGNNKVCRSSLYDLLKIDINSFEVETVLAKNDWRLLRFNFDTDNKDHFISCKELFNIIQKDKSLLENPDELSNKASNNIKILKTVPCFYNIQIADKCSGKCFYCPYPTNYKNKHGILPSESTNVMNKEKLFSLIKQISDYSQNAVISLSLWGESFNHPDLISIIREITNYAGLSVFLETDGLLVTDDFCNKLKEISDNINSKNTQWPKIMIAVSLDSFTNQTYLKIRGVENSLEDSKKVIQKLTESIGPNVYPQLVRINENEDELESFFNYWKNNENESKGNLIIQKYDDFAQDLPEDKPADLSPVERNICWHLRRDMTILSNGDVTVCKEYILDNIIGNVFEQSIDKIWEKSDSLLQEQIDNCFNKKCGKCDEYYTYNF